MYPQKCELFEVHCLKCYIKTLWSCFFLRWDI